MPESELQRILCVEDEADIREVAQLALEAVGGFEVRMCASGAQAQAVAAGFAPDLILLDVMMPDMDGPTTLAALRALPELAATPAVFMTARIQPKEIAHFKSLGALDVVAKPFDPMLLADALRSIWARKDD
jgi:two-component system, OmpR family, response regulator